MLKKKEEYKQDVEKAKELLRGLGIVEEDIAFIVHTFAVITDNPEMSETKFGVNMPVTAGAAEWEANVLASKGLPRDKAVEVYLLLRKYK